MNKTLLGCLLLGWQLLAAAQGLEPQGSPIHADVERQRIAQERASHQTVFEQAERQCYSRFAVSDCLRQARKERRVALDELRRQELILNDMDRQAKAIEALKRIESKVSGQQPPESAPPE